MIAGWMLHNPQKTSVTISVMVGRQAHSYLNNIGAENPVDYVGGSGNSGDSLVAANLISSDLAFNGTGPFTVTFYPDIGVASATNGNTRTIASIDNDSTDGIRFFQFDNLTQGATVSGVFEVNSGSSFGTRVRVSGSTLPVGDCKRVTMSCMAQASAGVGTNEIYGAEDFHCALPIARKIRALNPDYIQIPDDWTYQSDGGQPSETIQWARTKTVSDEVALQPLGIETFPYTTDSITNQSYDRSLDEKYIRCVHNISCSYLSPAMQMIGHTGSTAVMPQDHDFMLGNDYTHTVNDGAFSGYFGGVNATGHQNMLDNWSFCYNHWWRIFGSDSDGDRNPPCYGAEAFTVPPQVVADSATYDSTYTDTDYAPRYFKIQSDYCDDFCCDTFTHRTIRFDESGSSSLLGAAQKAEWFAEMQASTANFLTLTSPVNLIRSVNNNVQAYVSTDSRGTNAPVERNDIMTELKSYGKTIVIMSGDSHYLQMTTDGENIIEFNVAPVCRADTWHRARYMQQTESNKNEKWAKFDDLYLDQNDNNPAGGFPDASGNYHFSGRHEDCMGGAVIDQAIADNPTNTTIPNASFESGCGFGFSHFFENKAYHALINAEGLLIGSVVVVK